jgi:NAD(P)-dependent dehydrogenase (short-subunit alcohol dehydrogenase family)
MKMMQQMLEDKVALVTGAGRGIGREIALMMAAHGARVVVNDPGVSLEGRDESDAPASDVVREIRAAGGQGVADFGSVADADAARQMVERAVDTFGRIDIVVNNAGILRDVIFHKMTFDDWDSVIKVHLYGSFNVSRAAAEHFRRQESGTFVHMTSTSGLVGNPGQANYSAAKMGIIGLSKSLALDMRKFNVRSNCISPFAWSRMVGSIPNTPDQEARLAGLRMLTPDKIAPVAVFLASDQSAEVNGQILAVRGNEIFLMSQPRPMRSVHRSEGWTPETLRDHALPALRQSFVPLDMSRDVFSWTPV